MAIRLIDNSSLLNLADAIRDGCRLDPTIKMPPSEMEGYIRSYTPDFTFSTEKFTEYWSLAGMIGVFLPSGTNNLCQKYSNNAFMLASVRGNNTDNLHAAYANCSNLYGQPVCGDKVTDMFQAYQGCYQLRGHPVCGLNVSVMAYAYRDSSVSGYPVCGPNVINMAYTYSNCPNLTGQPVCGPNVINMVYAYSNCSNLTGQPVCGPNVINMSCAYSNCSNLTGQPVCGPNVTHLSNAYNNCSNLTGQPVCGPNVFAMGYTYNNCSNLTGYPVCGDKVTSMSCAYSNCSNLTGQPVCGPNVTHLSNAYINCRNLIGEPIIGPNVTFLVHTYRNCINIMGDARVNVCRIPIVTNQRINIYNAFRDCKHLNSVTLCGIGDPDYYTGNLIFTNSYMDYDGAFGNILNINDLYYPNGELNTSIDGLFNIFLNGPNTTAINDDFLSMFNSTTYGKQFLQNLFDVSQFHDFYNIVFDEPINVPKLHVYADENGVIQRRTEYVPCYYKRTIDVFAGSYFQIRIYAEYPGYFNG